MLRMERFYPIETQGEPWTAPDTAAWLGARVTGNRTSATNPRGVSARASNAPSECGA